jgi:hypothetical protein
MKTGVIHRTFFDLARACHPLLIAYDDPTYWVGKSGTCFLAEYRGRLFALTARHCVSPASGKDLIIAWHERESAPMRAAYQRTLDRELKNEEEDLYIIELDRERMSPGYSASLMPLCIDAGPPMYLLHHALEPEICIPGFPHDRTVIDYDKKEVAPKPTVLAAWYVGRGIDPACHEVKFEENADVAPSLDGFSGSPVFWVPKRSGIRYFAFVGMLLRGNTSEGSFLGASVIVRGLDAIIDQNPNG